MFDEIRSKLVGLADPEYAEFITHGAATDYPVIGVRRGDIRRISDEILDGEYSYFLEKFVPQSREEMMIYSDVLAGKINRECKKSGEAQEEDAEILSGDTREQLYDFLSKIDSWEITDTFCSTLKCVKKNREGWLLEIDTLLESGKEFFVRTGLVLLLDYYVEADWIQIVLERILKVKNNDEKYYISMAIAWLIQKCYAKYPDITFGFLTSADVSRKTLKRAISKIQDSRKIDEDWKERAKELLKNK